MENYGQARIITFKNIRNQQDSTAAGNIQDYHLQSNNTLQRPRDVWGNKCFSHTLDCAKTQMLKATDSGSLSSRLLYHTFIRLM